MCSYLVFTYKFKGFIIRNSRVFINNKRICPIISSFSALLFKELFNNWLPVNTKCSFLYFLVVGGRVNIVFFRCFSFEIHCISTHSHFIILAGIYDLLDKILFFGTNVICYKKKIAENQCSLLFLQKTVVKNNICESPLFDRISKLVQQLSFGINRKINFVYNLVPRKNIHWESTLKNSEELSFLQKGKRVENNNMYFTFKHIIIIRCTYNIFSQKFELNGL